MIVVTYSYNVRPIFVYIVIHCELSVLL